MILIAFCDDSYPGGVLIYLAERGCAARMGRTFSQEILKHGSRFLQKNP